MEWLVPANLYFSREAGESPGTGPALGDTTESGLGGGLDYAPAVLPTVGGVNHFSLGFFASDVNGDTAQAQPFAFLAALEYARQAGAGVYIQRGGQSVQMRDAGAVFPNASGNFYVDPSDVGLGNGQIPPDPATLQASQLAGHPMVFLRNPNRVSALMSQQADQDLRALNLPIPLTPVQVYTVDAAPDGSRWVMSIDGSPMTLDIQHPPGSNFRRPADVWNALVAGQIERPVPFEITRLVGSVPPLTWETRGAFARVSYLDYGRYLGPLWADGQVRTTPLYPGAPPPP